MVLDEKRMDRSNLYRYLLRLLTICLRHRERPTPPRDTQSRSMVGGGGGAGSTFFASAFGLGVDDLGVLGF
jgi:hypothetical protein